MRRLLLVVLAAAVGATLYATTAPAGHQTPPSRAEFNAVKARLAKVERDNRAVQTVLGACLQRGVPVSRYDGYLMLDQNGQAFPTSALDVDDESGSTPQVYLLDVGQQCANALAQTQHRTLTIVRPRTATRVHR
jgi:hypothetical protein